MDRSPLLSVVVICWNSLERLRQLLDSVPDALAGIPHELILIDNGSTDGTADYIASFHPEIIYRRLGSNRGVAAARNRGIALAKGDYIWLLDDDTVINSEAVGAMLRHMEANPQCGICGCALRTPEGELQQSYKPFPSVGVKLHNVLGIGKADPYADAMALGKPFSPFYIIGACQLIRRKTLEEVGPLDERIFYGPEDADFCLRAARRGWSTVYLPDVSITHHWKRITTRRPLSKIGRAHIRGLLHFFLKHRRIF